jgi:hypothetical protein
MADEATPNLPSRDFAAAAVFYARAGIPRYHPAAPDPSGLTIAYLIDPDGTLLRLIQND